MAHLSELATLCLALVTQACALAASDEEAAPGPSAPALPPQPALGTPSLRCEGLDDLGLAASGIVLQKSSVFAQDAPCIGLEDHRVASFGNRACTAVEPRGSAQEACVDTYDCGGCVLEIRRDPEYGFVAEGAVQDDACLDVAGRYALIAGPVCGAALGHL
ncbi:MAG: hypothetical protein U0263_31060 [Polyangiaceae bacterium]